MEDLGIKAQFWSGRSVFLTGHTGFKGGWLALWLAKLGARVHGYSQAPPTEPNFYSEIGLQRYLESSHSGDVRDISTLCKALTQAQPSVVFHLAAQALVRASYEQPVETFSTNVMGTVTLLEAVRSVNSIEAVLNVTSDKCYQNIGKKVLYREGDRLGGSDPYSCSKACAELASTAYRDSFLSTGRVRLASARAGNVVGGGDWATDRLLPDFFRALDAGEPALIRSPWAIRPWQHVLEPLSGYLQLAEKLVHREADCDRGWNFGPRKSDCKSVANVLNSLCSKLPHARWTQITDNSARNESEILMLDSTQAQVSLGWRSRWTLEKALTKTVEWHSAWIAQRRMDEVSLQQITDYESQ